MRTVLTVIVMMIATPTLAAVVIVAGLLGVPNRPGGVYDRVPRLWSRLALWLAGVRLVLHGDDTLRQERPRVFVSNHVSWYDIFTLLAILPRYRFVAKAELFKIPLFGPAARRAGTIPIQRENRKAAFQSYEEAAREIRAGASVVVCPEGTRGDDYTLRPFKKGPFVLHCRRSAGHAARGLWYARSAAEGFIRDPFGHGPRAFPRGDSDGGDALRRSRPTGRRMLAAHGCGAGTRTRSGELQDSIAS